MPLLARNGSKRALELIDDTLDAKRSKLEADGATVQNGGGVPAAWLHPAAQASVQLLQQQQMQPGPPGPPMVGPALHLQRVLFITVHKECSDTCAASVGCVGENAPDGGGAHLGDTPVVTHKYDTETYHTAVNLWACPRKVWQCQVCSPCSWLHPSLLCLLPLLTWSIATNIVCVSPIKRNQNMVASITAPLSVPSYRRQP